MSGFHGAFATGVACQQGTLTLPDTWFRPPFWDLLVLQLLRPDSSNLPCLYSTFHLEYPLVLAYDAIAKPDVIWYYCICGLPNINTSLFEDFRLDNTVTSMFKLIESKALHKYKHRHRPPLQTSPKRKQREGQSLTKRKLRVISVNLQSIRVKKSYYIIR